MRRALQGQGQGAVRVDEASSASTFRELDEAFLQVRSRSFSVWLGLLGEQGANGTVSVLAWTSGPPRFGGVVPPGRTRSCIGARLSSDSIRGGALDSNGSHARYCNRIPC